MTSDAERFLARVIDSADGDSEVEQVIDIKELKEIINVEKRYSRLLEELHEKGYIENFRQVEDDTVAVKLSKKGSGYFKRESVSVVSHSDGGWKKRKNFDKIHEQVMDKYIKKRVGSLEIEPATFGDYSELFQYFVKVKNDDSEEQKVENLFEFIVDKVHQTQNENYIKILGPDGTGKSTFLSLLYLYLYESYCENRLQEYPYYINLHYYDREVVDVRCLEEINGAIEKKIREDLKELLKLSESNEETNFLIIIDGNDKYNRTHLRSGVFLEKVLKGIKVHKKIICLGEKTNIHFYRERKPNAYIDSETSFTFYFSPIYINERKKWGDIIEKFCQIYNFRKQIIKISECIDKFNIKEIDFNLLTVFCEVSKKRNLANIFSISNLYSEYCLDYLEQDEKSLKTSIFLAYKYFMTEDFIDQSIIYSNWREWELVHQHKAMSNYLLALHYSDLIFEGKEENYAQFQCVFTNGINIFLKSIINEGQDRQKRAKMFCEILFEKGDFRAKAQAAYLLGRFIDTDLQDEARELLKEQLEIWERESAVKCKEQVKRQRYFVKRSILVSLLNLEESTAGETLLKELFDYPLMNEVNRGFYLQYYDDVPQRQPEMVNLKDTGRYKITHTVSVLFNYVNNPFKKKQTDLNLTGSFDFQIHLFTLCSLIQIRLNDKQYNAERDELCMILSRAIEEMESSLEDNMLVYISMLLDDIKNKANTIGHLYHELYALKDIQRSGWVEKIQKGSIQVDRFENVVEHTYYAWLLGMLYLPEKKPEGEKYNKYDKKKILNCLLIHDLAETYMGDHLPEKTTGLIKAEEKDIIQAIYQFCVYKRGGAIFEKWKEEEWRKEKNKIKTAPGKKILEEVVLKNFRDILEKS